MAANKASNPLLSKAVADAISLYCSLVIVGLILVTTYRETTMLTTYNDDDDGAIISNLHNHRACDEIYVVGEGETLHTISDKCDDPFIVENNPHVHDPDDVFPGLVIRITPPIY